MCSLGENSYVGMSTAAVRLGIGIGIGIGQGGVWGWCIALVEGKE